MTVHGQIARGVLMGLLLVLVGLASPAVAAAVDVDFETPPLAEGTVVAGQFAGQGVSFETGPPGGATSLPVVRTSVARSGARTLDISEGGEFPIPRLSGRFSVTRQSVTLHARNVTPDGTFSADLRLELLDVTGAVVAAATRAVSSTAGYVPLSATSASANVVRFRLAPANVMTGFGHEIRVDDLSFAGMSVTPDFALSASTGIVVLAQGQLRSTTIEIGRVNGSTGNVSFATAGLPPGVSAVFGPNPVGGSGEATQLTLSAAPDAQPTGGRVQITVTGTPGSAAVGSGSREIRLEILVARAYWLTTSQTAPVSLAPCSSDMLPVRIERGEAVDATLDFTVTSSGGGPVPAGLSGAFEPASLSGFGSATTLRLARGDTRGGGSLSLWVRARGGALPEQSVSVDVNLAPMTVGSVTQPGVSSAALRPSAPQALRPGDFVFVAGTGFCPGASVQFGGASGSAPLVQLPNGVWRAQVPRLARDGRLTVVNPSGESATSSLTIDIQRYRDTHGFRFANEAWQGGSFADWEELFGYEQMRLGADLCFPFGCDVTTPVPRLDLLAFIPVANAALRGANGTCVGFAIASRRIITGQNRGFLGAGGKLWDLPRSEPLIHHLRIQHQAQLGAEFLRRYLGRRLAGAAGIRNASVFRREVEDHLRAARRPMIVMAQGGSGHAVIAYDTEDRPGGGFFIRVWDNNVPATPAENTPDNSINGPEQMSRIEVLPDNRWQYPNLRKTVNGANVPWDGPIGDILPIGVENELPLRPTYPVAVDGLHTLIFGAGTSTGVSRAGGGVRAARAATGLPPGVTRFAPLNGRPIDAFIAQTANANSFGVQADARGRQHLTSFGDGNLADISTTGPQGGRAALAIARGADGLRYETQAASVSLTAKLASRARDGETHLATLATRSFRNGGDQVSFADKGRTLSFRHDGREASARLELSSYGGKALPGHFRGTLRLHAGDRVTVRPRWRDLTASRLTVSVRGRRGTRTLTLRNRQRPALVVRSVRASARRSGRRVIVTVKTRLSGRTRNATQGIGVVALRGGRAVGRQTQMASGRRVRLGTRSTRLTVAIRRGSLRGLRLRVSVTAMSGRPPLASRRGASARVR